MLPSNAGTQIGDHITSVFQNFIISEFPNIFVVNTEQHTPPEATLSNKGVPPAVVTPLAVSAGGGMFPKDDDRLPGGADRNGRHWLRVELSSTLLKYRTALKRQFWKRRPNGVFAQSLRPPDRGVS